jgi:transcriptional regulator with XRE-family HTH domain
MKHPEFAARVFFLRNKKKLSQTELAQKCGVDRTAVVHWEAGRATPRHIKALADALEMTVSAFYGAKVPSKTKAAA